VKDGVEIDELTSDEIAAALMFGAETVTEFAKNAASVFAVRRAQPSTRS
jgi:hypothetical protein